MKRFFTLCIVLMVCNSSFALTKISGGSVSGTWTTSGSPYQIFGDISISTGNTLTIQPGVTVEFQGFYKLNVQGRLLAIGTSSSFINISASSSSTGWKGIRFDNTPSTNDSSKIIYCKISYGKATTGSFEEQQGGAVFVKGFSKLLISNSILSNNQAGYYGGAISCRYSASPVIVNNIICNNTSLSIGGGIYTYSLSNPILLNNTIVNNEASSSGGGIYINGTYPLIQNCIIWGNYAYSYPQVYSSYSISFDYSDIEGGYSGKTNIDADPLFVSESKAAGVGYNGLVADWRIKTGSPCINRGNTYSYAKYLLPYDVGGNFRLDNDTIDIGAYEYVSSTLASGNINTNTTWKGQILVTGDITILSNAKLTIKPNARVVFTGPYKITVTYGSISAIGYPDSFISFTAKYTSTGWKGIKFYNTSASSDTSYFRFCKFTYGKATTGSAPDVYGGALTIWYFNKVVLENSKIGNNTAQYGGALMVYNSSPRINGNLIVNNEATTYGGAFYLYNTSSMLFCNNTIANNKAVSGYGGGIYLSGSSTALKNCIIYGNTSSTATYNNVNPTTIAADYCCIEGGYGTGTGNISSNPNFNYPTTASGSAYDALTNNDWTLKSTSGCIDAGSTTITGFKLLSYDLLNKQRVYNSRIDIGAYEDKSFISVCGSISSNTVWDANKVKITCNVTVNSGVTLTILPGTIVEFQGEYKLAIKGRIIAIGTSNKYITFTALTPSTGWKGLRFENPSYVNDTSRLQYCIFQYGKASGSGHENSGGGVYVYYWNKVTIDFCKFLNNQAGSSYYGGGLCAYVSNISITNSYFSSNSAYSGGGLAVISATCHIQNDTFVNNTSGYDGGGVLLQTMNETKMFNCFVANNSSTYYGGGIRLYNYNNGKISNNVIVNNEARYGAGISAYYDCPSEIYNNTIANNKASNYGGALHVDYNSDVSLKNNIIYGNTATTSGNQVYISDVGSDPKFYYNTIQGGSAGFAGNGSGTSYSGVYSNNGDYNPGFVSASSGSGLAYSGISANWAIANGSKGINTGTSDTFGLSLPLIDIRNNPRIFNGRIDVGAIENQSDIIVCGTISQNTVWDADTIRVNCDIVVQDGVTLTIEKGTVIDFLGFYKLEVRGQLLVNGTASQNVIFTASDTSYFWKVDSLRGGWRGIKFISVKSTNDSSKIYYAVIQYAKATGPSYSDYNGGGIYIYNSSKILISNSLIANNRAKYQGGGIYVESCEPIIVNNTIINNTAWGLKSGSYYYGYGGGFYIKDANISLFNNTIANNTAKYGAGGYLWASSPTIKNCIFYGNKSTTGYWYYGDNLYLIQGSKPTIDYCDIEGGSYYIIGNGYISSYTNNISQNPLFISPTIVKGAGADISASNWALEPSSPCINAALKGFAALPTQDRSGYNRIVADTIDMGSYEVQISEKFLTSQPVNKTVCVGSSVSFSTSASVNVVYQWQKDGNNITGANSSTYTIASVKTTDSGYYACILSNNYGRIATDTVSLKVLTVPVITVDPTVASKCVGQSNTFSVSATGSSPLYYQWYNTNGQLSGASNSSYTINSLTSNDASSYYCIVSNTCGSDQSNGATLTIKTSPVVSSLSPANTVCESNSITYTTSATGTSTITYKWYKNGSFITGATSTSYNIPSATTSYAGNYYCKATNSCGSDSTNISVLTVNTKPVISSQTSTTQAVCAGKSMNFSVTATGTQPLTYQWYKNSAMITGATNNTYSISSTITTDAGNYYCVVNNSCGNVQSSTIALSINQAPVITSQTASTTRCVAQSMTFSVTATGTATLTYQWYKDNVAISAATNDQYTINSVLTTSAGNYYCIVTNGCGSTSSSTITLSINTAPTIGYQTSNSTVCEGKSMTFSISASGTSPITYQWYKSSSGITGATNSSYVINSVATSDAASYYCIATNTCGSAQSNSITLTVNQAPLITAQSSSTSKCVNQSMTFSVTASGTAPLTYQWYYNNAAITSATNDQYSISSVNSGSAGNYYCVVTNTCGSVSSSSIALTINTAPSITSQSSNTSICTGQSTSFNVVTTGTSPITYQWYKSSSAVSGATNYLFTLNNVSSSDAATYYCIATNSCGNIQSNNIVLTVNQAPSITAQSGTATRCTGQSNTFSVTASGTSPLTYQWYKDGVSISSATNSSYTISSLSSTDAANYYCIVTNSCGNATCLTQTLSVNTAAKVTYQSPSATKCIGEGVTFSVTSTGTSPITYQWYYNSSPITGATNNFYSISNVASSNAGSYYCIATNSCGSDQSGNITLTVNLPPTISTYTSNSTRCESQSMTFSITASGTIPITYQWYKDGVIISGATNNNYTINSVALNDLGNYYCIAKNSCGTDQSASTTLLVNTKPSIVSFSSSDTLCAGDNTVLNVSVSGTSPFSYQWYQNVMPISGATNNFYLINSAKKAHEGNYYCTVTNSCGSTNSSALQLFVNNPVNILKQSKDTSKCEGEVATLYVNAMGTYPITYQWYNSKGLISNAISSSYTILHIAQSDADIYYCEIKNPCGVYYSANIKLVVNNNPKVSLGNDTTFCNGGSLVLSPGQGYFCKWNTGSINPQIIADQSGEYFVHVTDIYGCQAWSDTVNINVLYPFGSEQICVVTNDPYSGKNLIGWMRTKGQRTASYKVYRESTAAGVYELIGTLPFDSISVLVDNNSNPKQRAYRYRLTCVDSCGNESNPSTTHKTVHLAVNQGVGNSINLIWSHYEGFEFKTYKIFRGTDPDSMLVIDSIQSTLNSYTDNNPPSGVVFYQVAVVKEDTCYPAIFRAGTKSNSGPFSQSMSNIKDYSIGSAAYMEVFPQQIVLDSNYGANGTFELFTNQTDWNVESSQGWLMLEKDVANQTIKVTALSKNPFAYGRTAYVTIHSPSMKYITVEVVQSGTETSSIFNKPMTGTLKIYPNPINSTTVVEFPDYVNRIQNLKILDVSGKVIFEESDIDNHIYSLSGIDLPKGIYIIKSIADGMYVGKFVVE